MTLSNIDIIIGPTASGKSALAVEYALEHGNAAIFNADAMQCYTDLPILSAQPTPDEQAGVPHHLYGFLDSREALTAAGWVKHVIAAIESQDRHPIIVGGTGFYIKALTQGMSPIPEVDPAIRTSLMDELDAIGLPELYMRLQSQDPDIAQRLKPGDTQRILRALEIFTGTGKPLSYWQSIPPVLPRPDWQFTYHTLTPTREVLAAKITARIHAMLAAGLMDEIKNLSDKIDDGIVPENAAITIAHGFKHFRAALKGTMTMDDAIAQTALETRQYTKRQRTWLRGQIGA